MRALSVLLVLLSILGCGARDVPAPTPTRTPPAAEPAHDTVSRVADDYWEWALRNSPEEATSDGDHRFDDRLTDLSPAAFARQEAEAKELLRRLDALGDVGGEDALTADVLRMELGATIDSARLHLERIDVDSMDGPQVGFPRRMAKHPQRDARDIETLLARYRAFPAYIDQYVANLRAGLAEKRAAPRVVVDRVIAQLRDLLAAEPAKSRFAGAASDVPALPEPERAKLSAALVTATEQLIYPAYRGLLDFLDKEYRPASREDVGLWALPDGGEIYAVAIWERTTTRRTPAELHELGARELSKIEDEMRAIAARLGKPGEPRAAEERLANDPAERFVDRAQMLSEYRRTIERFRARMSEEFTSTPTDLAIEPMSEFMERHAPAAYYDFPSEDGARKGTFYVNTWQPETRLRFKMEALAAHEGLPGHHLQISIAFGLKELPKARQRAGMTAFTEGWGVYAERLVDEMGLYSNDRARFGMLAAQAWRASRLVVDTGIHAMKWTRERAVDYLLAHTAMPRREVELEVDRYIVWPAQGMAYTVGALEIFAARADAQAAMGPRFSRKAFHDRLLASGAIPLDTMRREIAKWARRDLR